MSKECKIVLSIECWTLQSNKNVLQHFVFKFESWIKIFWKRTIIAMKIYKTNQLNVYRMYKLISFFAEKFLFIQLKKNLIENWVVQRGWFVQGKKKIGKNLILKLHLSSSLWSEMQIVHSEREAEIQTQMKGYGETEWVIKRKLYVEKANV